MSEEHNEDTIQVAQERAYELAHDVIVAATNGDEEGADWLQALFAETVKTILNTGRQPLTDTA